MQYRELYRMGKDRLMEAKIPEAELDARLLLEEVCGTDRNDLLVHGDREIAPEQSERYLDFIHRRQKHEPLQQITGYQEFMGLRFKVTPDVLIPRQDTEILVEAVLQRLPAAGENTTLADIGTGTGAICLSLLNYLPKLRAMAVDISPGALAVAQENSLSLGLSQRVEFFQGDLLAPLKAKGELLNAIVSNPPYIPKADIAALASDVKAYEPMGALDGGEDGLDFYRRLLAESGDLLKDGGFLAMEVGIHQACQLEALAKDMSQWGKCEILRDLAGIERVVILWKA